jgi:hypothetical protein
MEDEGNDGAAAANSEVRYIALELMKLAQQSGRSFREVADEYLENACRLQEMISGSEEGLARGGAKARHR